ncbi:MAG: YegP family protein [Anaerolineales bacterium]|nr:YegP family protein [Anaerolineales bacterium]
MAQPKFVIQLGKGGFRFNLLAANSEPILRSEQYTTKSAAKRGIASVKANAGKDSNYERKVARNGEPFFNLRARNNKVIGTSETYSSNSAMENGIRAVKEAAPKAAVEDRSK